ncbi:Peroxidase [Frankliniella fusca]|uniref:Peroxidase n=1 Tax=Frankliniella fusca TaxID=407009 RepID=A0AAE1HS85_9NEOP|nr:Peroxidase [Frankliniella fusca]
MRKPHPVLLATLLFLILPNLRRILGVLLGDARFCLCAGVMLGLPPGRRLLSLSRSCSTALLVMSAAIMYLSAVPAAAADAGVQDDCEFLSTTCPPVLLFRPHDGSCNNPRFPWLGRANTPLYRVLHPAYADGRGAARRGQRGQPLPSAQEVVTRLMPEVHHEFLTTHLFVIWAQLISHDTAFIKAPKNQATGPCCERGAGRDPGDRCLPIPVPYDDPFYSQFRVSCLPLTRTNSTSCAAGGAYDEQLTSVSHFMDASFVYGSDAATAKRLRSGEGGQLRARDVGEGWGGEGWIGQFPPSDATSAPLCSSSIPSASSSTSSTTSSPSSTTSSSSPACYLTGDLRANQNPMLAGLQTLLLREHNRVAAALADLNPHWEDERVYQEARRVVVAEWQLITYRDWLRWLLGEDSVKRLGLVPQGATPRSEYYADVDPRTANDVTTAAFRSLHSMVQGDFWVGMGGPRRGAGGGGYSRGRQGHGDEEAAAAARTEALGEWFDNPAPLLERARGLRDVLQGLAYQQSQDLDRWMDNEITEQYEPVRAPDGRRWGNNLAAVDIQRGRDHGLPGYVAYRRLAGLPEASSFDDLLDTISWEDVSELRQVYEHVFDVDLYVGALLERRAHGALLFGPTYQAMLEDQFWRWRFADRFFYNFAGFAHSLREGDDHQRRHEQQILALEGTSVARLLCDNVAGFDFVPRDPFIKIGFRGNENVPCSELPEVDLSHWQEHRDGRGE